jgi:hypothetical protein
MRKFYVHSDPSLNNQHPCTTCAPPLAPFAGAGGVRSLFEPTFVGAGCVIPRGDKEVVRFNLASPGRSQPLIPRLTRVDGGTGGGGEVRV